MYGFWIFTIKKLIYDKYYKNYFEMYGEVVSLDETACIIEDCYGQRYRITWPRLERFEKLEKPMEEI